MVKKYDVVDINVNRIEDIEVVYEGYSETGLKRLLLGLWAMHEIEPLEDIHKLDIEGLNECFSGIGYGIMEK